MPALGAGIHVFKAAHQRRGWPGLLYGPETSPTGVRGHGRHIIIAWIRLPRRPSMPWQEVSIMDQRREFVELAMQEGANRRELCRRFKIHPATGYKWLGRWATDEELADRSRRPHSSPRRTERPMEARILALRDAHPAGGARKSRREARRRVSGLRRLHRICSGRWTSKGGWRCLMALAATR